jgi:hypothetical protein
MMSNRNKKRGKTCVITLVLRSCDNLWCTTAHENGGQTSYVRFQIHSVYFSVKS